MKQIGIYARKSIYSDSSDSINNQIRMCQEYIERRYPDEELQFLVYADEDFTGSNIKRPDLTKLVEDATTGLLNIVIVYQLDRLSRNVRDFSNLYSSFDEHNVKFISVKEQIDTSTPMGKASMYMTAVFAQMERENIATRVDDNMIGLAKMGLWTGGNPPLGYVRKKIVLNGRQHTTIDVVPDEAAFVNELVDIFLSMKLTLCGMQTYLKNHNTRTYHNQSFFSTGQIHHLLSSPVGVAATMEVYDYFAAKGCIMDSQSPRDQYNGEHGLIIYGRTSQKKGKHVLQAPEHWRICLGLHKPIIAADKWLNAQKQFGINLFHKNSKYDPPLLKGVLRCKCGRKMAIARKKLVNSTSCAYRCAKKNNYGRELCSMSQIKCELLDEKVIDIFNKINTNPDYINQFLTSTTSVKKRGRAKRTIQKAIQQTEIKIKNLTLQLSDVNSSTAGKYIIQEIENLDEKISTLNHELTDLGVYEQSSQNLKIIKQHKIEQISHFSKNFDNFSKLEQNRIVQELITHCVWDGETLHLTL